MMTADEVDTSPLVRFTVYERPVSVNAALRKAPRGHLYQTPQARSYVDSVQWECLLWRAEQGYGLGLPFPGLERGARVRLTVWGVRGDADNYAKLSLDGLKGGLHVDDRHFTDVQCLKIRSKPGMAPGVRIEVWPHP